MLAATSLQFIHSGRDDLMQSPNSLAKAASPGLRCSSITSSYHYYSGCFSRIVDSRLAFVRCFVGITDWIILLLLRRHCCQSNEQRCHHEAMSRVSLTQKSVLLLVWGRALLTLQNCPALISSLCHNHRHSCVSYQCDSSGSNRLLPPQQQCDSVTYYCTTA